MKLRIVKIIALTFLSLILLGTSITFAHPGRLDANGGHNCSASSKAKGLCTGYHWHDANGNPVYTKPGTTKPKQSKPTQNQPKPVKVIIDGATQSYSQQPIVENGSTLVPMRGIFESLGATVKWDASTKTVTGKKDDTTVTLTIGSKTAKVNGKTVNLSKEAKVINGSTMVPLRFISESLGASVKWDGSTRTVTINSAKSTVQKDKQLATIVRVVDGDTVNVMLNGKEEGVRLLLVDTPETVHPSLPVQPFGKEASDFAKKTLTVGKQVQLEYDGPERDKYGRVLAYIWVDGKNFNKMLLENGLARVAYVYDPPYKHYNTFIAAEAKAKASKLGIWSIPGYVSDEGFNEKAS